MRLLFLTPLLAACAGGQTSVPGSTTGTDSGTTGGIDSGAAELCGPDAPVGLEPGQCAPDFTLPDASGQPFTLSDQRGKVALVDISAVW